VLTMGERLARSRTQSGDGEGRIVAFRRDDGSGGLSKEVGVAEVPNAMHVMVVEL
jgi:hypothetical protein